MGDLVYVIRRYNRTDIPAMVMYLERGLRLFHYSRCNYIASKVETMLRANLWNSEFFCNVIIDENGEVGGALAATVLEYMFSYEAYAQDHIFYIRDGFHSLRAASELIKSYVAWGKSKGVRAVRLDQSTGHKMAKFAVFMQRMKFSQIGTTFQMEI